MKRFGAGLGRFWGADRPSATVAAVAFVGYAGLWWSNGAVADVDTESYRVAAREFLDGADAISDRVPGYPLFLILTGAVESASSRGLLLAQLGLHVVAVLLIVATARRLGVPGRLRLAVTVLLLLPPVVARSRYILSEGLAEFFVVVAMWSFTRWCTTRRSSDLFVVGLAAGVAAWVRPTFTAWFLVVGLVVWGAARSERRSTGASPVRQALLAGGVGLAVVVVLVVGNLVRFDYPSTTPLLGWNLSTKTSSYVEEMQGDDDVRDLLVEARDRSLVEGASHTGVMYIWDVRDEIGPVAGVSGRELDQYMLQLNLRLIATNPQDYSAAVTRAMSSYVLLYSPVEADFGIRPLVLLWMLIHLGLTVVFLVQGCVVAGLVMLRRLPGRILWPLVFGYSLLLYNMAISTLFEIGNPRYRTPTDAVAVLMLAVGLTVWREARHDAAAEVSPG